MARAAHPPRPPAETRACIRERLPARAVNHPLLLAGLTILLWSFGSYLSRLVSLKSQFVLLALSYLFTLATLLAYSALKHRRAWLQEVGRVRLGHIIFGPCGYFIYSIGLVQSYRHFDSASETTVLNYTWPVFTIVFTELLFGRRRKRTASGRLVEGVGVGLGFLSVLVLATRGNPAAFETTNVGGVLWGLLAGVSYGLFSAYSSTVSADEQSVFLLAAITTSLLLMAGCSVAEIHLLHTFTVQDMLVAVVLGCLLHGVGYITWTRANRLARERGTNISSVASLMFVLPLLSLTVIAVLLKEQQIFQPYFIGSLLLVIASSVLCRRGGR